MAYEGEILNACGVVEVDLTKVAVVAVSGSGPNVCGHMILHSPSRGGFYFHVAGFYGPPRYMSEAQYRKYLKANGKRELLRRYLELPDPRRAELYLESLLCGNWLWLVLPNNCVRFCEVIIQAGGAEWGTYSNCPTVATDVPQQAINRFLQTLEGEIYRLYGVPR